jgi:glycosyltransferase involved in cell wall biosynthesis
MLLTVLFYVFVVATGIQIIYYLLFSSILIKNKKEVITSSEYPISVIVYNKNNEDYLRNNLSVLLNQEYSKFEILILDSGTDSYTKELIADFLIKYNNLKIIKVENNKAFWGNKKYALTLGIKAAQYDHLLFTNAKTKILSKDWITKMSSNFSKSKIINIGYQKLSKNDSFLNLLVRFENLITDIQCFSFIKINSPFMAFGDNLAFNKTAFFNVKGFIYHIKVANGEDDLFIRDAATKENITYTLCPESFVENESPNSMSSWFASLKSKKSLQKHYKFKQRFLLSVFSLTKVLFYVVGIISLFFFSWQITIPLVFFYFLIQFVVVGLSAKKLKDFDLIFFLPILEISLILIQISIFIAKSFLKTDR